VRAAVRKRAAASTPAAETTVRAGSLALSGGGTRGIVHVGVIKVSEEIHAPVYGVTGTVMGAVVGRIYATGRPSERLEKAVRAADRSTICRDAPPRTEVAARLGVTFLR